MPEQKKLSDEQRIAYTNLQIPEKNRIILSLDGGGVRGILTLQLLKQIEKIAGIPCYKFCDLVAGTSTGAIIAGMIAYGKTAAQIEELYVEFVTKVFLKRNFLSDRFINLPKYNKENYRGVLKSILGNTTLKDVCTNTGIDILITAKDVTDNEETFFTCFNKADGITGTYQDALLRTVMEATMSAPTYFHPLERFIDGGTTTYNNPSVAALLEAVRYDGRGKYEEANITLFSLGTGKLVKSVQPDDAHNPKGLDVYFWLNYVLDESSQDASSMQSDFLRSEIVQTDYRRYQISLDEDAIALLPDRDISDLHITNAQWLRDVKNKELSAMEMDDTSKFGLLKTIGGAMVDYIMQENKFTKDLVKGNRDQLVTAFGNVSRIKQMVEDPDWLDNKTTT
ncbi:MAG: patatin-like phospholipase family protein [Agriterribacter sp.]